MFIECSKDGRTSDVVFVTRVGESCGFVDIIRIKEPAPIGKVEGYIEDPIVRIKINCNKSVDILIKALQELRGYLPNEPALCKKN